MTPMLMLIALLGAHFLCDYPLQGDFLAKAKDPQNPIPGVPWYQAMIAHCAIHGAAVALITGIWWLFIAEFFVHFFTDVLKCEKRINFNFDQLNHIFCKFVWWVICLLIVYHY